MNDHKSVSTNQFLNHILNSGLGKSKGLSKFLAKNEILDENEDGTEAAVLPIDTIYRNRLDSEFEFSMPSTIIRRGNPSKTVINTDSEKNYLFQITNFAPKRTKEVLMGPWITTNLNGSARVSTNGRWTTYSLSIDAQGLAKEGKLLEAFALIQSNRMEVDWTTVRASSWAYSRDRYGTPIIVDARILNPKPIKVNLLVGIFDGPYKASGDSVKITYTGLKFEIISALEPLYMEESYEEYDW